ncbi:MAG: hypothetical protein ACREIV_07405, partial [Planctomycetaceae bacterium]
PVADVEIYNKTISTTAAHRAEILIGDPGFPKTMNTIVACGLAPKESPREMASGAGYPMIS